MVFELVIVGTLYFPILHQNVIIRHDSRYFADYTMCTNAIEPALKLLSEDAREMSEKRKQFARRKYFVECKRLPGQRLTIRRAQGPA